jgi:hypothetical protein
MERKVGGNAGKGRKKGVPNKITGALKDMILGALEAAHDDGGVAYLVQQAKDNPNAFLSLVGRVLPMTVQGAGDEGEHKVTVTWLKP